MTHLSYSQRVLSNPHQSTSNHVEKVLTFRAPAQSISLTLGHKFSLVNWQLGCTSHSVLEIESWSVKANQSLESSWTYVISCSEQRLHSILLEYFIELKDPQSTYSSLVFVAKFESETAHIVMTKIIDCESRNLEMLIPHHRRLQFLSF